MTPEQPGGLRSPRPAIYTLAVGLLVLLLVAPPAFAHADLVETTPNPNTRVDQAPDRLDLVFSERLEDEYTNVRVLDRDGTNHVTRFAVDEDDRRQATAELDDLPDGMYTVRWQTLSQADGHTRSGVYFLAVNVSIAGQGDDGQPVPSNAITETGTQIPPLEPVFRSLGFLGAALAVGLPLFLLLTRGVELPPSLPSRLRGLAAGGAGAAVLAGIGLAAQLAARIDGSLGQAFGTANGSLLLLRIGLFASAALLYLAAVAKPRDALTPTWLGFGMLATTAGLLATTLGGHAAAQTDRLATAVIVDWLHQVAIGFWIGGVVALLLAGTDKVPEASAAALVRRFSPLAVASVLVVIVTGTISALHRLPTLDALTSSGYGWALVAKIVLMVPLVAMGAYHRYWLLPELETPGHARRDIGRLRFSAGIEAGLMVIVLVAAGLLTSLAPPAASPTAGGSQADQPEPYTRFNGSGINVSVFITPQPITVGFQEVYVNITSADGQDIDASELSVFGTSHPPSDPRGEASPQEAHVLFNGTHHFGGALFTEEGTWRVQLSIQGEIFLQETIEVEVQGG